LGSGRKPKMVYIYPLSSRYWWSTIDYVSCTSCDGTGGKIIHSSKEIDDQVEGLQLIINLVSETYNYLKSTVMQFFGY